VILYCDPSCQSLLHLHHRPQLEAKHGARGNPATGSKGPKRKNKVQSAEGSNAPRAPALKIPVPAGTVVKRKGRGVLAELVKAGDAVLVARGGRGGLGVTNRSRAQNMTFRKKQLEAEALGQVLVEDTNWKRDAKGGKGEQVHTYVHVVI
jgi:GTPase involved in cell partitioning and DNA repair